MNAHINLDLGIAAAQTAPGDDLADRRRDFDRINEILAGLVGGLGEQMAGISPWIGLLDRVGGRHDDELINFSLTIARRQAWRFAVELAALPVEHQAAPIRRRDTQVAQLADVVLRPGWLRVGLLLIRSREPFDVRRTIEALQAVPALSLALVETRVAQRTQGGD